MLYSNLYILYEIIFKVLFNSWKECLEINNYEKLIWKLYYEVSMNEIDLIMFIYFTTITKFFNIFEPTCDLCILNTKYKHSGFFHA